MSFFEPTPIDLAHLTSISGADEEFERELIEEFIETTQELMVEMSEAVEHEDRAEGARLAHTMKGSARSIGANAFAGVCQALEQALHQNHAQDVLVYMEQLNQHLERVVEFAQSHYPNAA